MKKLPPFTPVVVTWEDASQSSSDQYDSIDGCLKSYRPTIRKTHGLFVGYSERGGRQCLMLATDDDRTEDCSEGIGGPIYIPIGMVIGDPVALQFPQPRKK